MCSNVLVSLINFFFIVLGYLNQSKHIFVSLCLSLSFLVIKCRPISKSLLCSADIMELCKSNLDFGPRLYI